MEMNYSDSGPYHALTALATKLHIRRSTVFSIVLGYEPAYGPFPASPDIDEYALQRDAASMSYDLSQAGFASIAQRLDASVDHILSSRVPHAKTCLSLLFSIGSIDTSSNNRSLQELARDHPNCFALPDSSNEWQQSTSSESESVVLKAPRLFSSAVLSIYKLPASLSAVFSSADSHTPPKKASPPLTANVNHSTDSTVSANVPVFASQQYLDMLPEMEPFPMTAMERSVRPYPGASLLMDECLRYVLGVQATLLQEVLDDPSPVNMDALRRAGMALPLPVSLMKRLKEIRSSLATLRQCQDVCAVHMVGQSIVLQRLGMELHAICRHAEFQFLQLRANREPVLGETTSSLLSFVNQCLTIERNMEMQRLASLLVPIVLTPDIDTSAVTVVNALYAHAPFSFPVQRLFMRVILPILRAVEEYLSFGRVSYAKDFSLDTLSEMSFLRPILHSLHDATQSALLLRQSSARLGIQLPIVKKLHLVVDENASKVQRNWFSFIVTHFEPLRAKLDVQYKKRLSDLYGSLYREKVLVKLATARQKQQQRDAITAKNAEDARQRKRDRMAQHQEQLKEVEERRRLAAENVQKERQREREREAEEKRVVATEKKRILTEYADRVAAVTPESPMVKRLMESAENSETTGGDEPMSSVDDNENSAAAVSKGTDSDQPSTAADATPLNEAESVPSTNSADGNEDGFVVVESEDDQKDDEDHDNEDEEDEDEDDQQDEGASQFEETSSMQPHIDEGEMHPIVPLSIRMNFFAPSTTDLSVRIGVPSMECTDDDIEVADGSALTSAALSPSRASHALPIETAVAELLHVPLQLYSRALSSLAVPAVLFNLGLREHVQTLRHYALMELGDLFDTFADVAFSKLDDPVFQGSSRFVTQRVFQHWFDTARRLTQYSDDDNSLAAGFKIVIRPGQGTDLPNTLEGGKATEAALPLVSGAGVALLDALGFSYAVPEPLDKFIDDSVLKQYNTVFLFLLKQKWVAKALRDAWILIKAHSNRKTARRDEWWLMERAQHEMHHFMDHLQSHLILQLFHADVSFIDRPSSDETLATLKQKLADHVGHCVSRCMLDTRCEPIMAIVINLFDIILRFRDQVRNYAAIATSADGKTGVGEFQRKAVLKQELERTRRQFAQYASFLHQVLGKLTSKGFGVYETEDDGAVRLDELLTKLDFNSWISSQSQLYR